MTRSASQVFIQPKLTECSSLCSGYPPFDHSTSFWMFDSNSPFMTTLPLHECENVFVFESLDQNYSATMNDQILIAFPHIGVFIY